MDSITSRMEPSSNGGERGYLLGFDNNKLGHAIVSFGNPDTADNVVTYVPGTGAKLSNIDGDRASCPADERESTLRRSRPQDCLRLVVGI